MKNKILIVFVALYVLFLGFQSLNSLDFYKYAKNGQLYNSPDWRNAQVFEWAINNVPEEVPLYSDRYGVVEYRLKRLTYMLPTSTGKRGRTQYFMEQLKIQKNAYIICFKDNWHRPPYLSNSEITEVNQELDLLVEVIDFPEATIWKVNL